MRGVSEYMMALHKELKENRGVADATASQYIRTLYSLNNDRSFANLAWLKNIESVSNRLTEYAESTQKTALSVIVSVLSLVKDKPTYKKIYAHWYNIMMAYANADKDKDTTKKTDKQDANWLSWDVVMAHVKRLAEESKGFAGKDLTAGNWDTVLSYMVLSLFTEFAPRRNQDYQLMYVVKSDKQVKEDDMNYLVLDSKKFIFNKFKTAKSHGQQVFPIPNDLFVVIQHYLASHPLIRGSTLTKKVTAKSPPLPFLVQHDGSPLTAVNAITRILNRIFGKNVGATMLRHIYLSSKYDVTEMNEDAEKMGHTSAMQHEYMKGGAEGTEDATAVEVVVPTMPASAS